MASKKKKTDRRKSQIFDLRLKDSSDEHANIEENEELKNLYQNKNYQPPELKKFETIHESPSKVRRGLIEEDGTLNIGKSQGHRYIDFASNKYWRSDDKEKNKKRKAMITKQFKGRKRRKMEPVSERAYDELLELIDNKEDTILESEGEEEENENNFVVEGFVLNLPGTVEGEVMEISQQLEKASVKESPCSFPEDDADIVRGVDEDNGSVAVNSKIDQMESGSDSRIPSLDCVWKSVKTSSSSSTEGNLSMRQDPSPTLNPSSMTSDTASRGKPSASSSTNSELSSVNSETIKIRDETLSSATCSSVFDVCSESPTQEEIMKLFNSEDLLFCGENTGSKPAKKDSKRRSVRRSVRRSARFQPKCNESGSGSVFAIEEFDFDDRRKKNRRVIPSVEDDDVFEKMETVDTDRLSIPEQLRDFGGFVSTKASAAGITDKMYDSAHRDSVLSSLESDKQPSVSSEKHFDEVSADEEVTEPQNKSKRRSSTYKDLSISLGGSYGHDISLPAVVRRSLTGEFVPRRSGELATRTSLDKAPSPSVLQQNSLQYQQPQQNSHQDQQPQQSSLQYQQPQQSSLQDQKLEDKPDKSNSLQENNDNGEHFCDVVNNEIDKLDISAVLDIPVHLTFPTTPMAKIDDIYHLPIHSDGISHLPSRSNGIFHLPNGQSCDVQMEEAMDHDGEGSKKHGNAPIEVGEALDHRNDVMEHEDEVVERVGDIECKDARNVSCNFSQVGVAITPASRKSLIPSIYKKDDTKSKCKSRLKFLPGNPQQESDKQKLLVPANIQEGASCNSQDMKAPSRLSVVPKYNNKGSVKSVSDAFFSDSEEEEIISGMFGSKQMSRNMMKEKDKINRGFLQKN